MMKFLSENLGTIITGIVIAGVITAVIFKMVKDRKKGKSSCGCDCGCCSNSKLCHSGKK